MFLFRTRDLPEQLTAEARSHDLDRGDTLYRQGEPVEAVFAVEYGRLQLCTSTSEGRQVPLYTVRTGECVAEAALFAQNYCSDVVAEIRSRVRSFPINTLRDTLRKRPDLAAEFMALQATRCNTLRISLELRSLRSARSRILRFIEISAPQGSDTVTLDRSLKNVADDLGLTHEVFYRTLKGLIAEGLVKRTKNTLELTGAYGRRLAAGNAG
ncbi:MAG: Crp/Fnr family transcriptional regulator [Bryobacterales bacterium]|nr:Crp/Fnr family transcriptional regulator [Bryobacterales bacterium]